MAGRGNAANAREAPIKVHAGGIGAPFVVATGADADDWAPIADHAPRPLIEPGEYSATCTAAKRVYHRGFKRHLVMLSFEIAEGPAAGVRLTRFYPANDRPGRGSLYYREWTVANQDCPPRRRDRMWLSKFPGKLYRVEVRTVEKAWDKRPQTPSLRYSKVSAILRLLATDEPIC